MKLPRKMFSRREFLKTAGVTGLALGISSLPTCASENKRKRLNVVIITTDDNDADSLGCFGCKLANITPNIDQLAAQGVRFEHAHTSSPTCQPSRLSLMTGKYPQTNGNTGHVDPLRSGIPTLSSVLRDNGYYTAIIGKQPNYPPDANFKWSRSRDDKGAPLLPDTWDDSSDGYWSMWRAPEGFYKGTKYLVSEAQKEHRPFFLHLNTSDPHRPWPGSIDEVDHLKKYTNFWKEKGLPLRPYPKKYSPWEVPIPGYLPDLPGVRVDLADYYSALHNADNAIGRIMDALREANVLDDTIVIYFGDQGAPFPTSKQNLYRYSTCIPLIIKWPGITKPNSVISDTMVSIIDIMPTILDGLNISSGAQMEGMSLIELLTGKTKKAREHVFTYYNYAFPGIQAFPMRAVQSREYLYIFNGWSGEMNINPKIPLVYDGEIDPLTGLCWKSMKEAAQTDPALKKRVDFIKKRTPEEFYDLSKDPFCLNNLINDANYKAQCSAYKRLLENHLVDMKDPILDKFYGKGPLPAQWLTHKQVSQK